MRFNNEPNFDASIEVSGGYFTISFGAAYALNFTFIFISESPISAPAC